MVQLTKTVAGAGPAPAERRWETLPDAVPMPTPVESGYADLNGIQMYYSTFGSGEPILLIHGGGGHADIWGGQVATLSKSHRVIVADSRGHGRSTRTEVPYSYHLMASDYVALLDFLKVEKTALIGWSDGGIIGIDIALNHPARLTCLYAEGALVSLDGADPDMATRKTVGLFRERMRADYRKLSRTPGQHEAFLAQVRHMWTTEPNWPKQVLATITTRTAIVAGDHDEVIKRGHTEYMASAIPGARLIILPDVSHFALLQAPDEYTASARDFIEGK